MKYKDHYDERLIAGIAIIVTVTIIAAWFGLKVFYV